MKVSSEDLLSIPNAISAAGLGMAVHGSMHADTLSGVVETAAGRLLDLADGPIARLTGQTSEFGAAVDATFDKFAGLAILINEGRKDIAPKPALGAIFVQNVVNGIATAAAMKKHPDEVLEPSHDGKLAMATQNAALALYASANLLKVRKPRMSAAIRYLGHAATTIGVGYYGGKATKQYIDRAKN